jgi:hypothetical protein
VALLKMTENDAYRSNYEYQELVFQAEQAQNNNKTTNNTGSDVEPRLQMCGMRASATILVGFLGSVMADNAGQSDSNVVSNVQ